MKKVLTIAGSDSIGGAGIQADIKTITMHKMYAMSVVTAITAQNSCGVYGVIDTPSDFTAKQLDCVFEDIRPDAVKIGMISTESNIVAVVDRLRFYNAQNIVIDPVIMATSGRKLLSEDSDLSKLFSLATLITPNIPEAEFLSGKEIKNLDDAVNSGSFLQKKYNVNVLIKGGHSNSKADDVLVTAENTYIISGNTVETSNHHGTGCTLSSAIACNLANGDSLIKSIEKAKKYLEGALINSSCFDWDNAPLNHCYQIL